MKKNIGSSDRLIRFIISFILLAVSFLAPLTAGWRALIFILAAFELVSASAAY